MIDNFDDDAADLVRAATTEAGRQQRAFVETEHMLLGLLQCEDDLVSRALMTHDLTQKSVELDIAVLSSPLMAERAAVGVPSRTRGFHRVLQLAIGQATELEHEVISPVHLLLGLIRFVEEFQSSPDARVVRGVTDTVIQLFAQRGISAREFRESTILLLKATQVEG